MNGRHALILTCSILAFAGLQHAWAQQPDPFEQEKCQKEFISLRTAVEVRGKALNELGKRKGSAQEACKLFRDYTSAESRMIKYLQDRQQACGIPDQFVAQAKEGHGKAVAMRNQVCQVATAPAAAPPPPSQGLSGALGTPGYGGPPAGTAGGSGVFDTLTGNVLRQ
jgi:hypothetical protein